MHALLAACRLASPISESDLLLAVNAIHVAVIDLHITPATRMFLGSV
jgi:hypothetical protein